MSEVSEGIMRGLQEAVEYSKGNLKARKLKHTFVAVRTYTAKEIKEIRSNLGMTQDMFAGIIGVSKKTVEAWESGRNTPNGAARRLISIMQMDPEFPQRYNIFE